MTSTPRCAASTEGDRNADDQPAAHIDVMPPAIAFGREICGELEQALRREWLVTNGLGGFAAGTVAGCQTRRYHGMLIAAERPPVVRTMLLVDLDIVARIHGRDYELACHEYGDGVVHPAGYRYLESFRLDRTVPTWTYALGPARLSKRIFMARGGNTTYIRYTLERSPEPLAVTVRPLCTGRDFHWQRRGGDGYEAQPTDRGVSIAATGVASRLDISADTGRFIAAPDIYWNLRHRLEAARGLDCAEDLYMPGVFELMLKDGETVNFTATIESQPKAATVALLQLRRHEAELLNAVGVDEPQWIRQLALAADQFIVASRGSQSATEPTKRDGMTVIAGYPWFGDWGRDTMIALPGLALATGRRVIAAEIMRTFAGLVSQGQLPNRFPDSGEAPEYNTADATLWYFVALHEYLRATKDLKLAREIYPILVDIVAWHRRGTRHGIIVDPTDGLLRAGAAGTQLTWMDAKVGDWVVTPRIGKPVEINALWCNALRILGRLAGQLGKSRAAAEFEAQGRAAAEVFAAKYWFADGQYLYDVIEGPDGQPPDTSLRPNQLIALALPHPVLDETRARLVLAACESELLTSYGLRTLEPAAPGYVEQYGSDQWRRDGAYHQGTVWPWLLGAFARAHFALYGDGQRARSYLAPLAQHLADACIGQVSEIFDAEPPHAPQGCFAQAWSVAEVLRSWLEIRALAGPPHAAQGAARRRKAS